jgi:hypothetical protein
MFRVEGHTQDYPGVPFQAMTAFAAESQSGKYSINYSYYTLKSPEIGISWIAWLNLSPQGRDLEIAAGILFPDLPEEGGKAHQSMSCLLVCLSGSFLLSSIPWPRPLVVVL